MDNSSMNLHNIADGIADSIEDDCKIKKVRESALLLKRKMCKTHDLIKQYSENMKEIDYLKSSLENAKKEAKHTISNYKFSMDKIRELELKIMEDKQTNEKLINQINKCEINIAADKQIMQQLTCKIKDLEDERSTKNMEYNLQKSFFEDKIKDLEYELKKSKITSMHKKKEKKMLSLDSTTKPNTDTKSSSDIGINVSLCELSTKCEVQDKNIMTDEFYNVKDDPHPLFCAKCEAHLPPDLTPEKICKTMSAYPKLIERDLSPLSPPKKTYSPPCSLLSTYPESVNRNEDALSRISVPHLNPYSPYSDSVVSNPKSQSGRLSTMAQNNENVELRNVDISPVVANLSGNLGSIPAVFTLPQNRNYAREDFYPDNLLTKHSPSIKEMEKKIRSLESKMKKFRKLKKKINKKNSCHRNINYKDDMLNSNLISVICKSVMEYYDEKKEVCFKNKHDTDSEKCICSTKETEKQLNKSNNICKNIFSCKAENYNERYQVCNMFCNKIENAAKTIDLSDERTSVHKNTLLSDINTSSMSLNDTDESDKREVDLHEKSTLHSAEGVSIEDELVTSHLSTDKVYTNDTLLDKDNIETVDVDNKRETEIVLTNDENSTDYVDGKITDIHTGKNEIKNKSQDVYEDKVDEVCTSNNLLSKDNVEAIDADNKTETEIVLSNDENSTDHVDGKMTDINAEKNEIKNNSQNIHEDKVDEVSTSDNLLSKDNIEAIDVDNKTRIEIVLSNNENPTDHVDDKITEINTEKNEIKDKIQNIHKDKVDEVCTSDNFLSKHNVKTIDMDNETETGTIFVSNDEHSIDHSDGKIDDIDVEKNVITSEAQNIHADKVDETYASDNLLNKNNVESIDMDNQVETETTFLSNDKNSTDHIDSKIIEINAEKNIITSEIQNTHTDKVGEIYGSDNLLNKNNVETIDMDNQIKTETISSNDENSSDSKIIDINAETNEIKSKSQNIHKIGKIYTNNNLLNKNNIEAIDMDNQTKIGRVSLYKNKNSVDHTDDKIIAINAKESKIKRKDENICKTKVGDRLLKKLRSLKRKTRANSRINKQESIESYSDHSFEYNELSKKLRIENEEGSSDRSLKNNVNLKRKLDTPVESINKPEDNKLCSDDYEPVKKLRIAHTPKTLFPELNIKKNDFTHSTIRNIASLVMRKNNMNQLGTCTRKNNLLIENKKSCIITEKCDEKNVKSIETNNINRKPMNEKGLDLTNAEDCLQNNDTALSAINIERVSEKCKDVLIEDTMNRRISMDKIIAKTSSNDRPDASRNITNDTTNDLKFKELSIPLKTCIITQSKSSILCKDSTYDRLTEALETIESKKDITPTAQLEHKALGNKGHDDHKKSKDSISNGDCSNMLKATRNLSNNYSDIFNKIIKVRHSPSLRDSIIVEDGTNDNNMKESLNEIKNADKREKTCVNNKTIRIQAVKIQRKNACVSQQDEGTKLNDVSDEVEDKSQTPMSRLNKYIKQKRIKKYKLPRKQISYISKITDKFIKKQLRRLINSAWEETILDDIIDKLKNTCGPRIIAKCIVEFLLKEVDHNEVLDKSFTPPAPLMTTFEQKIITLLKDLEVLKPTVIYFVQAGIEYNLFKLNTNVKTPVLSLTRIYVALSLIQKDREKMRMMCCDAFYCMGLKSIDILHTVLTCWSQVLPNAKVNKEILPKCIAFLIGSYQIHENEYTDVTRFIRKLSALKTFVLRFYEYTYTQETKSDTVTELMTALKAERMNGLDTAIILIAKREGPNWTYKNIIQSVLLPMIKNEHPKYNVFPLLGRLLRAFPLEDKNNIVKNISEHLCDLVKSGQGSHDQQENIMSALLSLSRLKFDIVAPFLVNWVPSKPLKPIINTQLQAFINLRNPNFWKKYLELLKTKNNDNSG